RGAPPAKQIIEPGGDLPNLLGMNGCLDAGLKNQVGDAGADLRSNTENERVIKARSRQRHTRREAGSQSKGSRPVRDSPATEGERRWRSIAPPEDSSIEHACSPASRSLSSAGWRSRQPRPPTPPPPRTPSARMCSESPPA